MVSLDEISERVPIEELSRDETLASRSPAGGSDLPGGVTPPAKRSFRSSIELVSLILAPSSILTGLLFYFGWVYTNARSLYFGIDPSLLGFGTSDYLLRSFDVLQIPLRAALLVILVFVKGHAPLMAWAEGGQHGRSLRRLTNLIGAIGCFLLIVGFSGYTPWPVFGTRFLITQLGLCFGTGALAYSSFLKRAVRLKPADNSAGNRRTEVLGAVAMGLFMTLTLFLAVGQWADSAGKQSARRLEALLPLARPSVTVYSEKNLHLGGPGVAVSEFSDPDAAYRFRYTGLSLLIRSGGKYFLLPTQWSPGHAAAIVLDESKSIRMEFTPGSLPVQPQIR